MNMNRFFNFWKCEGNPSKWWYYIKSQCGLGSTNTFGLNWYIDDLVPATKLYAYSSVASISEIQKEIWKNDLK